MLKSKILFNVIRVSVLCGVSLQLLEPSFAGWHKDIASMDSIGETELRTLKARCHLSLMTLLEEKKQNIKKSVVDPTSDQKREIWNQRGLRVMDLIKGNNHLSVDEKKGILFDKSSYIDVLCQKKPEIRFIINGQKERDPGLFKTHVMSIFEAKSEDTQEEVTPEYLQKTLAESGLDINEQKRQFEAFMAQNNKTTVKEEKKSDTRINNSSQTLKTFNKPEATFNHDYLETFMKEAGLSEDEKREHRKQVINSNGFQEIAPVVEEKFLVANLSEIAQEIADLEFSLTLYGDSFEENNAKGMVKEKLQELRKIHKIGATTYAFEQERDYYLLNAMSFTETIDPPTFIIETELHELENSILPMVLGDGSEEAIQNTIARILKLKDAQARGMIAYSKETDL